MPDYALFDVTLTAITPLHIGNGNELLNEYDYAIHNNQTWRINEMALLDAVQGVDDLALAEQLARSKPQELLKPEQYSPNSGLFRYVLDGAPRSKEPGAQLNEQLKDVFDHPYIPGTTLKGAIRTALAWHLWEVHKLQPDVRRLGRGAKWAAQEYEQALFGPNPNHDLMRALHVTDSVPVEPERLMVVNVRVLNRGGSMGSPIELEAIRPDTALTLTMKIDRALFSDWAKEHGLRLPGATLLEQLPQVVQGHTNERIRRELAWFKQIDGATRLVQFYQQLDRAKLGSRHYLIQIGWGTGWGDKTFGSRLADNVAFRERIIRDYRLARGRRQEGDPFPKSRRVVVSFQRANNGRTVESPASPLGWCLVEMKARTL